MFRQTNAEHEMIGWLHEARKSAGVAINPAAFCYHSVAVLDAIKMCECPVVEVHISNIHARVREAEWRDKTILTPVCTGMISGLGIHGYALAVEHIGRLSAPARRTRLSTMAVAGIAETKSRAAHASASAVLGLVTIGTLINYLDRTVISVTAPSAERGSRSRPRAHGDRTLRVRLDVRGRANTGGILLDRLGVRLTYFLSVTLWSLCTINRPRVGARVARRHTARTGVSRGSGVPEQ